MLECRVWLKIMKAASNRLFDLQMTSGEASKSAAGEIAVLGQPKSKIARLLDKIKSMPDVLDMGLTHDFRTSIDDAFVKMKEVRRLPTSTSDEAVWEFASFGKLFKHTIAESPAFKAVFQDLQRRRPGTPDNPWSLVRGEVYPAGHAPCPFNPTVEKAHS